MEKFNDADGKLLSLSLLANESGAHFLRLCAERERTAAARHTPNNKRARLSNEKKSFLYFKQQQRAAQKNWKQRRGAFLCTGSHPTARKYMFVCAHIPMYKASQKCAALSLSHSGALSPVGTHFVNQKRERLLFSMDLLWKYGFIINTSKNMNIFCASTAAAGSGGGNDQKNKMRCALCVPALMLKKAAFNVQFVRSSSIHYFFSWRCTASCCAVCKCVI